LKDKTRKVDKLGKTHSGAKITRNVTNASNTTNSANSTNSTNSTKIPHGVLRRMGERIISQTREPWERIEASLPEGVTAETVLNASALSVTYIFAHEQMSELGRINARFTGDGLSLSQLYCGFREADDAFKGYREAMMQSIYDSAKAAFAE
jgi:hypothetical protein